MSRNRLQSDHSPQFEPTGHPVPLGHRVLRFVVAWVLLAVVLSVVAGLIGSHLVPDGWQSALFGIGLWSLAAVFAWVFEWRRSGKSTDNAG